MGQMPKRLKTAAALFCSIFALFSWTVAFPQDYIKPLPSLPSTLDPKYYTDAYSIIIATQIFDRLFDVDEYLTIKPNLVSSFESKDSGKKWILHIRKDIKFHNGKPLDAQDVAFSIRRLLQKGSVKYHELSLIAGAKQYHEGAAQDVSGIKVLSDDTLEIELTTPFQPFLSIFTAPNTEILPKNFAGKSESEFFKEPIGTGAFKFAGMIPDKYIELNANEGYFASKPKLRKIRFEKADLKTAIDKFNVGYFHDLEWYLDIDLSMLKTSYNVIKAPSAATYLISFNLRSPPLDNVYIRNAIELAIPREEIIRECFPDRQTANGIVPPGIGGFYPEISKIKYAPDSAIKEIAKADLDEALLRREIVILRPDNHPCQKEFKKIVEHSLKKIGLNAVVKHLPLETIYKNYYTPNKHDIVVLYYTSDNPEAFLLLNRFRSSAPHNFTGVKSQEIDKTLDSIMVEPNRYERYKLYRKIQDIIQKNALVLPISYNIYTGVYQRFVRGIEAAPLTVYNLPMRSVYLKTDK